MQSIFLYCVRLSNIRPTLPWMFYLCFILFCLLYHTNFPFTSHCPQCKNNCLYWPIDIHNLLTPSSKYSFKLFIICRPPTIDVQYTICLSMLETCSVVWRHYLRPQFPLAMWKVNSCLLFLFTMHLTVSTKQTSIQPYCYLVLIVCQEERLNKISLFCLQDWSFSETKY